MEHSPAPAAPTAAARRTRKTDGWTTLFLVLTGTLGAWSLVLVVLTLLAIIRASGKADDDMFALKSLGAGTVAVIAIGQAFTMGAAMGKVPRFGLSMRTLMRTHRYAGRLALVLAAVVAYFCWSVAAVPTRRASIHGGLASSAFLAISLKLALLKWRPALAHRVAPWLGAYAALALIAEALVSGAAYLLDDH
jgi:hypothetical protein